MLELTRTALRALPRGPSVEETVGDVRLKNGTVFAWIRAVIATGSLVPHATSGGWTLPSQHAGLAVHAVLAAVAIATVALLNARWRPATVMLGAAIIDVVGLAIGGWLLTSSGGLPEGAIAGVAFMVALTELFILAAAMTLPLSVAAVVGGIALGAQLMASARVGLHGLDLLAVAMTHAAFAAVAAWAGTRMVGLAASTAADKHAALVARRRAEDALAAHAEAAAQRDSLLDARAISEELSAAIVHDLKNPLATLLQYAALAESQLQEAGAAPQVLADLRLIGDEGRRLAKLIGDLLLVHRLERGGLQLRREPIPVPLLLERVAESHRPRARQRGVTVEVRAPAALMASIDAELTLRFLENLVANALRHVGDGDRIELAASATDEGLRLAVRNSGAPVPAEARSKLFEKYATKGRREWHNAGLGLYLCRLVAEAHGGRCELAERDGWSVSFEGLFRG
jgi:signal transduction histidine kinase